MMGAQLTPGRMLTLSGVLAPIGAVMVAKVLLGSSPASAPAAGIDDPGPIAVVVDGGSAVTLSMTQEAALGFLHAAATPGNRSPMTRPEAPPPEVNPEDLIPTEFVEEPDDPADHLKVTSIVGKGDRSFASLNGRIYRVGDEVGPGWRISVIDASSMRVVLTSEGGDTRILEYKANESNDALDPGRGG